MKKVKKTEYEFCMSQFKPAVATIVLLVILVVGWVMWNCRVEGLQHRRGIGFALAAVTKPPAKAISVKDKAPHPYWGNCNKCHITVDPPANPVSKVFAGAPISIKDPMPHEYWGNCNLCHKVTDGFQPPKKVAGKAKAAAFNRITSKTLGLKLQTVTADVMRKFGLANEDGVLVLEVAAGSIAERYGLLVGDEIIRLGNITLDTVADFDSTVNNAEPGSILKFNLYRGKKGRNLFVKIPVEPATAVNPIAATSPMTQKRVETLVKQLNLPKTQQAVQQALNQQGHTRTAGIVNYGKVAVASLGPDIYSQVATQFCASPYFIVFDPVNNSSKKVANPNFNDATGRGIQTGQYMVDLGVKNVIAGNYSANAYNTLRSLHLNVYSGITGSVNDVLSMYRNGQLQPNTVNAHAGVAGQSLQGTPTASPPQNRGVVF
jgi:predicted Fe-Mo cluster-binding NifX family protein